MARGPGTATAKVQGLSARQYAVVALLGIIKNGATLDDALTGVLAHVESAQDRGLVRAIVSVTLRRKGQIDDALRQFLTKPLPAKSGSAGVILQAAAAQLLFMRVPAHAAIDLAVRLARADRNARHFSGLINAVLRKIATAGDELLQNQDAARLNTPDWLMQVWRKTYGAETALRIAEAHLTEPPLDLTVRTRSETERWATALGGNVLPTGTIRLSERSGRIEDLPG
ncbi:MAG: transcription antitermination factor NusB, partial [Aestuariivirgaceae bacterium]